MSRHTERTFNRKAQVAWVTGTLALGGIAVTGGAQAFSGGSHPDSKNTDRVTSVAATRSNGSENGDAAANGDHKNTREAMCARLDADVARAIAASAAKSPQAGKSPQAVRVSRLANGDVVVPLQAVHLYRCPAGSKPPVAVPPSTIPPVTTPPISTDPAPSTSTLPPAPSTTLPPAPSTTTPPPAPSSTKPPVITPPPAPSTTKPPASTTTPPVVTSTGS